jgi:hypothetical protein
VCKVQHTSLSSASSYTAALAAGPLSAACLAPPGSGTADYKYWNKARGVYPVAADTQHHQTFNKTAQNELYPTAFSTTTELNEDVN